MLKVWTKTEVGDKLNIGFVGDRQTKKHTHSAIINIDDYVFNISNDKTLFKNWKIIVDNEIRKPVVSLW